MSVELQSEQKKINRVLYEICDPEIPVLSIMDMGIVRGVELNGEEVKVIITPTYTGCPAMDMISVNIKSALMNAGYKTVIVESILSPAWTTDWITETGRKRLLEYGIAPPAGSVNKGELNSENLVIGCPLCKSTNTEMISLFGSTACKALYRCKDCKEPFDYFKCH